MRDRVSITTKRLAAELVAFDVLGPTLRSRAAAEADARKLSQSKPFIKRMTTHFQEHPAGQLQILGLIDLADKVAKLETRLSALEDRANAAAPKLH